MRALDLRAIALGLGFVVMWASAFSSARIIVSNAPPIPALTVRFLISGLMAVGWAAALGQTMRLSRAQWVQTVVFGVCQNALYLGLFFVAMQTVEAGLAAIIASAMPLVVAALARIFLGERIAPLGVVGLVAGFAGVALIMSGRLQGGGADPVGLALAVVGVLALAVATLMVRGASSGGNVMMVIGLQMLVGSAALAPVALLAEPRPVNFSWQLAAAFAYTTLVPGLAATWVWFRLVRRVGATRAAVWHFLSPFIGVSVAALLLGERLGPRDMLGVVIITFAILAVQVSRRPAAG